MAETDIDILIKHIESVGVYTVKDNPRLIISFEKECSPSLRDTVGGMSFPIHVEHSEFVKTVLSALKTLNQQEKREQREREETFERERLKELAKKYPDKAKALAIDLGS